MADFGAELDEGFTLAVGVLGELAYQVAYEGDGVGDFELDDGVDAAGAAGVGEELFLEDGEADEADGVSGFFVIVNAALEGGGGEFVGVVDDEEAAAAAGAVEDGVPALFAFAEAGDVGGEG